MYLQKKYQLPKTCVVDAQLVHYDQLLVRFFIVSKRHGDRLLSSFLVSW